MPALKNMEIGVMFWAGRDPLETLREVQGLGARCGQLGVPGGLPLDLRTAAQWNSALDVEQFPLVTVFAAYDGEAYDDIPTVVRTVGWIPPATRAARLKRTFEISDFAKALGAPSIALHVGCLPEDHEHPDFVAVREMTRLVCDYAADNGQTFALETGQEPARDLLEFFKAVDRPNLRINFDPANMILYGSGDPIEALGILAEHVISVHAKDGDWPAKDVAGALGVEQPLGKGAVGMARFVAKLKEIGYKNPINIEREVPDHNQRLIDMRAGINLLKVLTS